MNEAGCNEGQVARNPSRLVMGTNAVLKVGRLLMYGFSSDSRADIPTGLVLSLTRDSGTGTPDTLWSGVGESCIKKLITEAYSR